MNRAFPPGVLPVVEQFMLADIAIHMPGSLLNRLDRGSMAHSLEARVPFLSHHFVEWSLTMPRTAELRECLDACSACVETCLGAALRQAGLEPESAQERTRMRLLLACATLCRAAIEVMTTGSVHHAALCRDCAEVCSACALACRGSSELAATVTACLRCAAACRRAAPALAA